MVGAAALKAVQDILSFVSPLLLRQMICFTKLEDMDAYYGYLWAIMMFVVAVLQSLALQQVCALCAFYFPGRLLLTYVGVLDHQLIAFLVQCIESIPLQKYSHSNFALMFLFNCAILWCLVKTLDTRTDRALSLRQYFHRVFVTGMRLRAAVVTAVYQKSLRISNKARKVGIDIQ